MNLNGHGQHNMKGFQRMNELGASSTPFFFMADFEMENVLVYEMSELDDIFFDVKGVKNHKIPYQENEIPLTKGRIPFMEYKTAFDLPLQRITLWKHLFTQSD